MRMALCGPITAAHLGSVRMRLGQGHRQSPRAVVSTLQPAGTAGMDCARLLLQTCVPSGHAFRYNQSDTWYSTTHGRACS